MQQGDGGKGKGQYRYLAPEDAYGLAHPQAAEAPVAEQALATLAPAGGARTEPRLVIGRAVSRGGLDFGH